MFYNELKSFPDNFMWGASTSAYQVEGAFDADGKGKSVQDIHVTSKGITDFSVASDHYHHLEEDVSLMAKLGLKCYRFSIAWTRIIPDGDGEVNEKGLWFYSRLIDELLKYNIEPVVTMYHFDLPYELYKNGGWSDRNTIDAFERYASILFENYGSRVKYWLTINEQNVMINHPNAMNLGIIPDKKELYQQCHNMFVASARAVILCHQLCPKAKIGPAPNIISVYPESCRPKDILAADDWEAIRCWLYYDVSVKGCYTPSVWSYLQDRGLAPDVTDDDIEILKEGRADYLGLNYYATATVSAPKNDGTDCAPRNGDQQVMLGEEGLYRAAKNPYLAETPFGWIIDPEGLRITLRRVYDRYGIPILITENGLGAPDELSEDGKIHDEYRIEYLKKHFEQAKLAISDGVELIGYCPWAFIDLVSTHQGYKKRYGFVYVNRGEEELMDMRRIPKDSFEWYRKVIKNNDII